MIWIYMKHTIYFSLSEKNGALQENTDNNNNNEGHDDLF